MENQAVWPYNYPEGTASVIEEEAMEPVKTALIGAGDRGKFVYAQYAKINPKLMKIVAVAERSPEKRAVVREEHAIPGEYVFSGWEDAFGSLPPGTEAVIIATPDRLHHGPLAKAMEGNYHILCEKPVVPTLEECIEVEKAAERFNKVFMTGYVLEYTAFYMKLKELLDQGRIGKLIGIDAVENVGHLHMAHSFVRGNWRNLKESSPMILAKSCHDMDLLYWLSGAPCETISSHGDLHYFRAENAPAGSPSRCLDGCPHIMDCPYDAAKTYLTGNTGWPASTISTDLSIEGRIKALETGPYGRCVYRCDNDVVDHQTAAMQFANGVTANFTMSAFTMEIHRGIALFGTKGEIRGDLEENRFTVKEFASRNVETVELAKPVSAAGGGSLDGHSGGDFALITGFVNSIRGTGRERSSAGNVFESHYMALAAEYSRTHGGKSIPLNTFRTGGFA
jgi:predicted dehydrogenase